MLIKDKKCSNCDTYYDPTLRKCPHCYKSNELYLDRKVSDKIVFFHPFAQIGLFLAGFAYVGMILAELFFSFFVVLLDGSDIFKKTLLLLLTYSMMLGGLAIIVLTTRKNEFFSKYKRPLDYIYGLVYTITIVMASMMVGSLISIFHTAAENNNQQAALDIAHNYPLIAFFILGLL